MTAKTNNAPLSTNVNYTINSDEILGLVSRLSVEVNTSGEDVVTIIPELLSNQVWRLSSVPGAINQYKLQTTLGSVISYLTVTGRLVMITVSEANASEWNITGEENSLVEIRLVSQTPENGNYLTAPLNSGDPVSTSTKKPVGNSQKWKFITSVGIR